MANDSTTADRLHTRTWSEGGRFYAMIDELPGCMGDGETLLDAIEDCRLAALEWLDEAKRLGRVQ